MTLAACAGDDTQAEDEQIGTADSVTSSTVTATTVATTVHTTVVQATTETAAEPEATTQSAPVPLPGFDPPIGDQCPDGETPSIAGYDIASGALSWLTCLANGSGGHFVIGVDGEMVLAVELIVDRTVPAGGVAHYVGIDARDGTKRWELDSPAELGPNGVLFADGFAVVTLADVNAREVAAVDVMTGEIAWRVPLGDSRAIAATDQVVILQSSSPPPDWTPTTDLSASPQAATSYAFYSGLDRRTGATLWSHEIRSTVDRAVGDGASVSGDTAIVMPGPIALAAATGEELWRIDPGFNDGTPGPAADDVVTFGGQGDPTSGIDATTGEMLWTVPGSPEFDNVWAVGGGAVYVTDGTNLTAHELPDGSVRWTRDLQQMEYGWPWTASENVLFAIRPNLTALSTTDGSTLWRTNYPFNDPVQMTSAAAGATTVIVSFSSQPLRD